jgi:DNA-binding LacI/PurR family transcriptional regulator
MQVLGARAAILRAGYRVPDDFSVVVCDDLPLADFLVPPQATVSLPVYELGEASVRSLLAQIQGGTASDRRVETSPELNRRGSLAKYPGRSRQPNRLGVGGDQLAAVPAEELG